MMVDVESGLREVRVGSSCYNFLTFIKGVSVVILFLLQLLQYRIEPTTNIIKFIDKYCTH